MITKKAIRMRIGELEREIMLHIDQLETLL